MDLYLFDLDKTLYAYDFRRRLPALAWLAGVSQYRRAAELGTVSLLSNNPAATAAALPLIAPDEWVDGASVTDGFIGTIERFAGRPR